MGRRCAGNGARFHAAFPGIELTVETTTRAEGLRRLADGRSDLHLGGVDAGEALPAWLRRDRPRTARTHLGHHPFEAGARRAPPTRMMISRGFKVRVTVEPGFRTWFPA